MFHFENTAQFNFRVFTVRDIKIGMLSHRKESLLLILFQVLRDVLMHTYTSSRVKSKSIYRKSELQMFLLISGGHTGGGPKLYTNMASTKLYKGAWNVSANNSETVGYKDLRFGQIVCILVFYNIHFLGFFHWTVSNLFFLCAVFIAWQWKRRIERPTPWRNSFQKRLFSSILTSTAKRRFRTSLLWSAL